MAYHRHAAHKRETKRMKLLWMLPARVALAAALVVSTFAEAESDRGQVAGTKECSARFAPVRCIDPTRTRATRSTENGTVPSPQPSVSAKRSNRTVLAAAELDRGGSPSKTDALPTSKDELFGVEEEQPTPSAPVTPAAGAADSREALFGTEAPAQATKKPSPVRGFVQFEPAYTYASPGHWSRGVVRGQAEAHGQFTSTTKWKASLRLDVDPVYWSSDFYPDAVKKDQRLELLVRETYLDWAPGGNWDVRLGRQHIVWGEVVGLFFADVVSARDMRDFILPSFDVLRIPQWAARAEYFANDAHLELIWIPVPSYDNIGKPGAEFYPFRLPPTPGFNQVILDDNRPDNTLGNTNYGARVSKLMGGWDVSGFYYRSLSASPTLYREVQGGTAPTVVFEPRHDRIWQAGATVGKDLRHFVLKGEMVYTNGRGFEVTRLSEPTGVVSQNTLDYILSMDFVLPSEGRLNLQAFQRVFFDHDPDILYGRTETGASFLISAKITRKLEPQLLVIQSLDSNDRMLRPRLNWYAEQNLTVAFGVDIFAGPPTGYFGRFSDRDRIYGELRYSF